MSLTKAQVREILSEANVDAEHMKEAVDKIIDGHVASMNAVREEADTYKADAGKLEAVQKELDELKAHVAADAKEREGKDYDKLLQEFNTYKQEQEKKEKAAETQEKFKALLKDMNVSDEGIAKILKWQGTDAVELDEEGKISNAKDLRKSVKEDWPEYITTTETRGAETATPPASTGGQVKTKEDIFKISDAAERQKAIADNPELFGI